MICLFVLALQNNYFVTSKVQASASMLRIAGIRDIFLLSDSQVR